MNIGWPEGIWLALIASKIIVDVTHDGKPRKHNHNATVTFLMAVVSFGLLYWGGFFA